jgi:hypothetical protein
MVPNETVANVTKNRNGGSDLILLTDDIGPGGSAVPANDVEC